MIHPCHRQVDIVSGKTYRDAVGNNSLVSLDPNSSDIPTYRPSEHKLAAWSQADPSPEAGIAQAAFETPVIEVAANQETHDILAHPSVKYVGIAQHCH